MSRISLLLVAMAACLSSIHPVWSQSRLPDGNGQDVVEPLSSGHHELRRSEWRDVVGGKLGFGAPLSRDWSVASANHLVQNLPKTMKLPAVMNPGSVEVSIEEWLVPTPGSHPHDPLAAADGSIWYTGQMANLLGRLDPKTGEFKEYQLKTPQSGPHGLVADKDGDIWFTANFKGYIGKLDPNTGEIIEYPMPDPKARDPHTPIFEPALGDLSPAASWRHWLEFCLFHSSLASSPGV